MSITCLHPPHAPQMYVEVLPSSSRALLTSNTRRTMLILSPLLEYQALALSLSNTLSWTSPRWCIGRRPCSLATQQTLGTLPPAECNNHTCKSAVEIKFSWKYLLTTHVLLSSACVGYSRTHNACHSAQKFHDIVQIRTDTMFEKTYRNHGC